MSENIPIHDQNITAAFFMKGLHHVGFSECLSMWGYGCIELISELVSHVPFATTLCEKFNADGYPGVFDYEVSEHFGAWFGQYILDCYRAPSKIECEAWLSFAIAEFFNQGKIVKRWPRADNAWQQYNFGEGVSVAASDRWNTDDENDFTKIVYVTYDDDPADADPHKVSFHVRFNGNGQVEEVYALEMNHGNEVGFPGSIADANTSKAVPAIDDTGGYICPF